jgi:hypothetical protein
MKYCCFFLFLCVAVGCKKMDMGENTPIPENIIKRIDSFALTLPNCYGWSTQRPPITNNVLGDMILIQYHSGLTNHFDAEEFAKDQKKILEKEIEHIGRYYWGVGFLDGNTNYFVYHFD